MRKRNANVIVYVKQHVEQAQIRRLSNIVNNMRGVAETHISRVSESIFSVDYDPFTTDSKEILSCVKSQGYSAVLVGM